MSVIDQIIQLAIELEQKHTTPSIALLKSRLKTTATMPQLVQGLQRFKALSAQEKGSLIGNKSESNVKVIKSEQQSLSLESQLQQLQAQVEKLIEQNQKLEQRLQKLESNNVR